MRFPIKTKKTCVILHSYGKVYQRVPKPTKWNIKCFDRCWWLRSDAHILDLHEICPRNIGAIKKSPIPSHEILVDKFLEIWVSSQSPITQVVVAYYLALRVYNCLFEAIKQGMLKLADRSSSMSKGMIGSLQHLVTSTLCLPFYWLNLECGRYLGYLIFCSVF